MISPQTQIPFNTKLEHSLTNPKCPGGILIPIPVEIAHINPLVSVWSGIEYESSPVTSGVAQKGAGALRVISKYSLVKEKLELQPCKQSDDNISLHPAIISESLQSSIWSLSCGLDALPRTLSQLEDCSLIPIRVLWQMPLQEFLFKSYQNFHRGHCREEPQWKKEWGSNPAAQHGLKQVPNISELHFPLM